MNKGLNEAFIF